MNGQRPHQSLSYQYSNEYYKNNNCKTVAYYMKNISFAVEKKSNIFSEGRRNITSSLKIKNKKKYLTNLNLLFEKKGTLHH